MVFDSPRSILF